jgi:cyclic di-GMP phosphodiesterase
MGGFSVPGRPAAAVGYTARVTASSARAGNVLVIDDQDENCAALTEALAPLGYRVRSVYDGAAGLAAAREAMPDVVLLDVMMPGMDGFEVCRRLKADPETRLLPVVILTGLDSREARLQGLEAGATDFLTKPFNLVELETRVRNLVSFRRLTQELDSAEQMLFAVARAVEARDQQTGGHCDRLSRLAARLGTALDFDDDEVLALRRAGYLHDIGKVGIPDVVLLKPGPLDESEWAVMRTHVEIGVEICSPLHIFRPVLPIIRHHHERYDGAGYPDGLRGAEIPKLARVFQVADAFDALVTDRPYRAAMSIGDGLATLVAETGQGRWDPEATAALVELVECGDVEE